MSATRPELHVRKPRLTDPPAWPDADPIPVDHDPGPQGPWLEVLRNVETALHEPPSYAAHVALAFAIVGLVGMLLGSVLTIVLLRTAGAL